MHFISKSMSTFSALGIRTGYIKGLKELGIINPTEIQEQTIPKLLQSKTDFIGLAQTGTGKLLLLDYQFCIKLMQINL